MSSERLLSAPVSTIAVDATMVRQASQWLEEAATQHGVPQAQIMRLDLCLNEALANVMAHGGAAAMLVPVELELSVQPSPKASSAQLLIRDAGVAFDPTVAASRARPQSLLDAEPGGLGLVMMRSNCDDMAYQRLHGRNELALTVRWQPDV